MNRVLANRTVGPQRQQLFSAQRPPLPKVRQNTAQSSRDVRLRAGANDVGSSYANALVELAQEKDVLNDIHEDVETLTALFKEDNDLKAFLTNPIITEDKKKDMVSTLGDKAKFSEFFVNFINLLIDQDRLVSADSIFESFEKRYCELTDTQVATIYSAVKLEQEQQFLIAKKLQELTGAKNIKLKTVIDESLIAGFSVDFGSAQIDLSIKGQLEDVAADLVSGSSTLDLSGNNKAAPPSSNGSNGMTQEELIGNTNVEKEIEKELAAAK